MLLYRMASTGNTGSSNILQQGDSVDNTIDNSGILNLYGLAAVTKVILAIKLLQQYPTVFNNNNNNNKQSCIAP